MEKFTLNYGNHVDSFRDQCWCAYPSFGSNFIHSFDFISDLSPPQIELFQIPNFGPNHIGLLALFKLIDARAFNAFCYLTQTQVEIKRLLSQMS